MANEKTQEWKALCKAVSTEQDSVRLQALLTELLKSLDESGSVNRPGVLLTKDAPVLSA